MARNRRDLQTDTHRIDGVQVNSDPVNGKVQTAVIIENDSSTPVTVEPVSNEVTGTITNNLEVVSALALGCSTLAIQITGSIPVGGLIAVQGSVDNVTWSGNLLLFNTTTRNNQALIGDNLVYTTPIGGFKYMRAISIVWTAGNPVTVNLICTSGDGTENVNILNPIGQTVMSGSLPVVIASDQTEIPVTSKPAGLENQGLITRVTLNSTTWTALPASALVDRNGLGIQNDSNVKIKLNFDNTEPSFIGWGVNANGETFLDISNSVVVYAKSESGTPTITVMEVA